MDLDVTGEVYQIGGGVKYPLTDIVDVYALGQFINGKTDLGFLGLEGDADGSVFGAGVRGIINEKVDLDASVTYTNLTDPPGIEIDGFTTFNAKATYMFRDNIGLGLEWNRTDDDTGYIFKLRFAF